MSDFHIYGQNAYEYYCNEDIQEVIKVFTDYWAKNWETIKSMTMAQLNIISKRRKI